MKVETKKYSTGVAFLTFKDYEQANRVKQFFDKSEEGIYLGSNRVYVGLYKGL